VRADVRVWGSTPVPRSRSGEGGVLGSGAVPRAEEQSGEDRWRYDLPPNRMREHVDTVVGTAVVTLLLHCTLYTAALLLLPHGATVPLLGYVYSVSRLLGSMLVASPGYRGTSGTASSTATLAGSTLH